MDMQGTPIGSTNQGQKVTTDPRSNNAINEATGPVAKDSLAAESYEQGGGFSENKGAHPSAVSGSSSTWNNTDTSAANKLNAAPSAARRDDGESGTSRYPEALGGQGEFSGKHNDTTGAYSGGPTGSGGLSGSSGSQGTYGSSGQGNTGSSGQTGTGSSGYSASGSSGQGNTSSSGQGNSGSSGQYNTGSSTQSNTGSYSASGADSYGGSNAGTAPNYTLNTQGNFQHTKPKGDNITEGGFEGEGANYNSGIGTEDDPGRVALQGMLNKNAQAQPSGPTQIGRAGDEQPFDSLQRDESA